MTTKTWDPAGFQITLINTSAQLPLLSDAIGRAERVAVDTETYDATCFEDGLWSALRIIAVAVHYHDGAYEAFVVDARDVPAADLAQSSRLLRSPTVGMPTSTIASSSLQAARSSHGVAP